MSGGSNPFGIQATINNSNTAGVTAGSDYSWGGTVRTGVELRIPLAAIGNPSGPIKVCAFIGNPDNSMVSNQFMANIGTAAGNLGEPRGQSLADVGGPFGYQYFLVPYAPPTGGLVVLRVGDGNGAISNSAAPVFLDEYSSTQANQAAPANSVVIPTSTFGQNHQLTLAGAAVSEGRISRSNDGRFLVFTGYDAPTGTSNVSNTSSASVNRVVALIDKNRMIDTTTALTDAYSGNSSNTRCAWSFDGTKIWLAGTSGTAETGGIRFTTLGSTTSSQVSPSPTNMRTVQIFNNQLYATANTNGYVGVSAIGLGLPEDTGSTTTLLFGLTGTNPAPYEFYVADADTIYVADDSTQGAQGIEKWVLGDGVWAKVYTLSLGPGIRSVCGRKDHFGNNVLFAITADSRLVTVTDTVNPTFVTLATARSNTAFRGVALTPFIPSRAQATTGFPL